MSTDVCTFENELYHYY